MMVSLGEIYLSDTLTLLASLIHHSEVEIYKSKQESKKARKQDNKNSTKKVIKKQNLIFLVEFLFSFFFLTFLFSFMNLTSLVWAL